MCAGVECITNVGRLPAGTGLGGLMGGWMGRWVDGWAGGWQGDRDLWVYRRLRAVHVCGTL